MHRFRRSLAVLLALASLAGCNVLFVPRKPPSTPSPSPNTDVHQYPDLEARLPDEIDGQPLEKFSLKSDAEANSAKTLQVLARLGKTPADVQLARASATGVDVTAAAMRIVGTDAIQAAVAFQAVDEADPRSGAVYEPEVVAGKRVLIRTSGSSVGFTYIYPVEDILFIYSGNRALVEEALTKTR